MGSLGNSMMAVLSGDVRISVPSADGREIVLAILHENEYFGEIAMLAKREGARPRPAYQAHKWFARRFAVTARSR